MDVLEFLRESAPATEKADGSEQGSCDPHLIKTNWLDKRHKLNVQKRNMRSNFVQYHQPFC